MHRTIFLTLAILAMAVLAVAHQATPGKTHEVTAEFVSADAAAKTITLKSEDETMSIAAEGTALADAKAFESGDTVVATCRDDESGHHQAVTKLKAKPRAE